MKAILRKYHRILLIEWLACTTDSDCKPDMNSATCCSNGKFPDEVKGPCPTDRYKGYCTCNIPEGWSEGRCNGLKEIEPPPIAGEAKKID